MRQKICIYREICRENPPFSLFERKSLKFNDLRTIYICHHIATIAPIPATFYVSH